MLPLNENIHSDCDHEIKFLYQRIHNLEKENKSLKEWSNHYKNLLKELTACL